MQNLWQCKVVGEFIQRGSLNHGEGLLKTMLPTLFFLLLHVFYFHWIGPLGHFCLVSVCVSIFFLCLSPPFEIIFTEVLRRSPAISACNYNIIGTCIPIGKNSAYGRHLISRLMRIVAQILKGTDLFLWNIYIYFFLLLFFFTEFNKNFVALSWNSFCIWGVTK